MTSIVVPPEIDQKALPATPTQERASNATSNPRPPMVPALSTPGLDIPGAYPKEFAYETTPPAHGDETTAGLRESGADMLEAAKAYMPAREGMDKALGTVKGYLPKAVLEYFPNTPANDDTAHNGMSSTGVGNLPGSQSEEAVAKLPEERVVENTPRPYTPSLSTNFSTQTLYGSLANRSTVSTVSPTSGDENNPTAVSNGATAPGDLSFTETGVAVLPDEKRPDVKKAPGPTPLSNAQTSSTAADAGHSTFSSVPPVTTTTNNIGKLDTANVPQTQSQTRADSGHAKSPSSSGSLEGEGGGGEGKSPKRSSRFMQKLKGEARKMGIGRHHHEA